MKRGLILAAVLVLTAGLARDSYSQITGSITGVVRDQKGAVVADAKVLATRVATNQTKSTTTDSEGAYRFPALSVGA